MDLLSKPCGLGKFVICTKAVGVGLSSELHVLQTAVLIIQFLAAAAAYRSCAMHAMYVIVLFMARIPMLYLSVPICVLWYDLFLYS